MTGTIKTIVFNRGYGFLTAPDGKEYFFHYSDLAAGAFRDLAAGATMEFEPSETPKGPRAIKVRAAGESIEVEIA